MTGSALRIDRRYWAYLYVNLATLMWAGNMTLGRALRGQIGPLTLTAARVLIASVLLLLFFRQAAGRRSGGWDAMDRC